MRTNFSLEKYDKYIYFIDFGTVTLEDSIYTKGQFIMSENVLKIKRENSNFSPILSTSSCRIISIKINSISEYLSTHPFVSKDFFHFVATNLSKKCYDLYKDLAENFESEKKKKQKNMDYNLKGENNGTVIFGIDSLFTPKGLRKNFGRFIVTTKK